ncbi:MAG: MGMT family protein [Ktedonobacterales bacterium]|nr:MGMT family protein [Ktedonobacterales bacterium]
MADAPITLDEAGRIGARVHALVRRCPVGRVTTYGWIAHALGYGGGSGARMVGWFLNDLSGQTGVPAQRVINSKGELTGSWAFGKKGRMRELLEAEGIAFTEAGRVDLKRYGWDPSRDLSEEERQRLLADTTSPPAVVSDHLLRLLLDDVASPFRLRPVEP